MCAHEAIGWEAVGFVCAGIVMAAAGPRTGLRQPPRAEVRSAAFGFIILKGTGADGAPVKFQEEHADGISPRDFRP